MNITLDYRIRKMIRRSFFLFMGFALGTSISIAAYWTPLLATAPSRDELHVESLHPQQVMIQDLYQSSFAEDAAEKAMRDAEGRISPAFHVPKEMASLVRFWLDIYTEYSTQQVVLFDAAHPEIVYEVLDFSPIANSTKSRMLYEIITQNKTRKMVAAYRRAFQHLAKVPHPAHPTREETIILSSILKLPHRHSIKELARTFRSQTGQRDAVIVGLRSAAPYFAKMEQLFSELDVPQELTRLSIVESSFNLKATSRVGASGVWQFMPRSGKEFMTVDRKLGVDERLSPLKSTVAAAKLLKRNYKILNSWSLAVTSYNHGVGKLPRVRKAFKTEEEIYSIFAPCTKKNHLGWASKNYYAEFLAMLHADAYRDYFYGQFPENGLDTVSFVRISNSANAVAIAADHGISITEFRRLNPDVLKLSTVLPRGFRVALPAKDDNLALLMKTRSTLKLSRKKQHAQIKTRRV